MKKGSLVITAVISMILLCSSMATAALYSDWEQTEQHVFGLVNLQRSHHGLTALTADSRLHEAADLHSQDMARNDFFDHVGSGNTGPGDRMAAQGYDWRRSGENIAAGYTNAYSVMYGTDNLADLNAFDIQLGNDGFVDWNEVGQGWSGADWTAWGQADGGGWMTSTGHRENILDDRYTDLGIGYYYLLQDTGNINYSHYWTQDFASGDTAPAPAPAPIPAAVLLFGSGLIGLAGVKRFKMVG